MRRDSRQSQLGKGGRERRRCRTDATTIARPRAISGHNRPSVAGCPKINPPPCIHSRAPSRVRTSGMKRHNPRPASAWSSNGTPGTGLPGSNRKRPLPTNRRIGDSPGTRNFGTSGRNSGARWFRSIRHTSCRARLPRWIHTRKDEWQYASLTSSVAHLVPAKPAPGGGGQCISSRHTPIPAGRRTRVHNSVPSTKNLSIHLENPR